MSEAQQKTATPFKLLLTMEEAAQALGLSRTHFYELVMRKQIASIKIGRARRVPVAVLEDFVEQQIQNS